MNIIVKRQKLLLLEVEKKVKYFTVEFLDYKSY